MFSIFMKEKIATVGMLICFFFSILLRLLLALLYQRMIRETDNMATTNNRLLKQCKLKFSNCFQLNNGVSNVQVFVEKFMSRLSLGPFSFRALYHISGQLMLLSIVFSGIGVARSIVAGSMFGEILPFYICSLLELYLYFSLTTLLDIKGKRKALKVNLIDYLENHLSYRMQMTRADMQMLYGGVTHELPRSVDIMPIAGWLADREVEEAVDEETSGWQEMYQPKEGKKESALPPLDPEESEELEMLLKEILTLS